MITLEALTEIKKLNRHFDRQQKIELKDKWVKISVIKSKTIWQTKEQMRSQG